LYFFRAVVVVAVTLAGELRNRVSIPRKNKQVYFFPRVPRPALRPVQPLFRMVQGPFSVTGVTTYTAYDSSPSNSKFRNEWNYNAVLPYTSITCIAKSLTFPLCLSYFNLYPATYSRKFVFVHPDVLSYTI
jgi:hypothetical protein